MNNKIFKILTVFIVLTGASAASGEAGSSSPGRLLEIEIHRGDTLSRFAQRYLDDPSRWPELLEYNQLPSGDPNLILPGHKLLVPVDLVRDEIADIVYLKNNVRVRRKEAPSWTGVGLYERLFPDDGIRTGANSFTRLKYLTGGGININENSLVFLKPERTRDNVVHLEVGELRAQDVKVLTASASIDPGAGSDFSTIVDEKQTTTLSVYKGQVDFISSGSMVTVREGFMSRAELYKPPSQPMKLPEPPELKPVEGKAPPLAEPGVFDTAGVLDKINISGKAAVSGERDPVTGVHIQLARDEEFSRMMMDNIISSENPEEWKESLSDGTYWWRAALVTSSGVRGKFSEPVMHVVDTHPPVLQVDSPGEGEEIGRRVLSVRGKTRPGSTVLVNGRMAAVDAEGGFVLAIGVRYGVNELAISSTDTRNRTTERKIAFTGVPSEERSEGGGSLFATIGIIASALSIGIVILALMR